MNVPKNRFRRIKKKDWKPLPLIEEEEVIDEAWINSLEATEAKIGMTFQVSDAKKPLLAVKRLTEKGNKIGFGPKREDNFIENKEGTKRIILEPNGRGSYLLKGRFIKGGDVCEITVDSGAEESVCPIDWAAQYGLIPPRRAIRFKHAGGGKMEHYGEREVAITAPF